MFETYEFVNLEVVTNEQIQMSIQNFNSSTSALEKKKVMGKINSAIRGLYSEFGGRMLDQIQQSYLKNGTGYALLSVQLFLFSEIYFVLP